MRSLNPLFAFYSIAIMLLLLALARAEAAEIKHVVGTVVIATGHAYAQKKTGSERSLKANDPIEEGETIRTEKDGWVKIIFKDDSLADLGPRSRLGIQAVALNGQARDVLLKIIEGRSRHVIARRSGGGAQKYRIETPSALLYVRETELIVNAAPDGSKSQTEVICMHGQVTADIPRKSEDGTPYQQPIVINPGFYFAAKTKDGLDHGTSLKPLTQDQLRKLVAQMNPQADARTAPAVLKPLVSQLAGTGVPLQRTRAMALESMIAKKSAVPFEASSFERDLPPLDRRIASPSGNFEIPRDFKQDLDLLRGVQSARLGTDLPPISQLPATTSRVKVILNGI